MNFTLRQNLPNTDFKFNKKDKFTTTTDVIKSKADRYM